jgi:hypothetical protein
MGVSLRLPYLIFDRLLDRDPGPAPPARRAPTTHATPANDID